MDNVMWDVPVFANNARTNLGSLYITFRIVVRYPTRNKAHINIGLNMKEAFK